MKLTVLDASAIGGGPVSRALECAAGSVQRPGLQISRVRLYALFAASCAMCDTCRETGRCASRHVAVEGAAQALASADLLLVGVASSASQRDTRAEILLRRLVGAFGGVCESRSADASASTGFAKCAALISSAPPLLGIPTMLGALPYGLATVWRVLDRTGVEVVGSTSVARRWSGPAAWDQTRERASRLGRTLAGRAVERTAPVEEPRPLAPAAVVAVRAQPRVA